MPSAGAEACAAIVARDDPHLHATALFAPEPARSRLMVLYAFDVELGRAAAASQEVLIARMRLQWWRDVVAAARGGRPAPAHEVAGPLARLLTAGELPGDDLEALIAAREAELGGGPDAVGFAEWARDRFGALTAAAAHLLTGGHVESVGLARRAGPILGAAFALRHAAAIGQGAPLLPDLGPEDRATPAAGETTESARDTVSGIAREALAELARLRAGRRRLDRRAVPAFLPLVRARRVLERASRPGAMLRDVDDGVRPFDGLRLAWAAGTGRW